MKLVADDIKELDAELAQIDAQFDDLLMKIPNIPHSSVPDGADDRDNAEYAGSENRQSLILNRKHIGISASR